MSISIVTITLNSENTIDRCLRSVANQIHKPAEYLVIDGSSSDRTLEMVEPYKKKKVVDKAISKKDRGISHAFNRGIAAANEKYICLINSDDWIEPNYIEEAEKIIRISEPDIILGTLVFVKGNNHRTIQPKLPSEFPIKNWKNFRVNHPGSIIKKELLNKVGCYDEKYQYAMDVDLMLKLLKLSPTIAVMSNSKVFQGGEGVSQTHIAESLLEVALIELKFGRSVVKTSFALLFRIAKSLLKLFLIRWKLMSG